MNRLFAWVLVAAVLLAGGIFARSQDIRQTLPIPLPFIIGGWGTSENTLATINLLRVIDFSVGNTDTEVVLPTIVGAARYLNGNVRVYNASAVPTTATVGVFTAANGMGTTLAANQVIAITSTADNTAGNFSNLTAASSRVLLQSNTPSLFIRVGTSQAALTASVQVGVLWLP